EALPTIAPAFPVEPAHDEDPVDGIVGIGRWRKWPRHVRMNHGQKELGVFRVPPFRFQIDHLLNLGRDRRAHPPSSFRANDSLERRGHRCYAGFLPRLRGSWISGSKRESSNAARRCPMPDK